MRIPKLNPVEIVFVMLIGLTAAMSARDRLSASGDAIAAIQVLARQNDDAMRVVAVAMAAQPQMNIGEARRLRERVIAIELTATRLATDPAKRELIGERERLSAIPFWQMTFGDKVRWLLLGAGRYSALILGGFLGLCAVLLLRGNGRLSRFRFR
jgi:hypothetical protein